MFAPPLQFGGPIWRDPIHNVEFVKGLLKEVKVHKKDFGTADRITGLLTLIEEVNISVKVYRNLCKHTCTYIHLASMCTYTSWAFIPFQS